MKVFLSGAGTMLGAELLRALMARPEIEQIGIFVPLTRPEGPLLQRLESYCGALPSHVATTKLVTASAGTIVNGQLGNERMFLNLLEQEPSLRLHHVSTAWTAGTRRGLYTEFDLDCGQGFHDARERRHYDAETLLRQSFASRRIAIYRPSHLLGRSDGGEAFSLDGGYPLLASLAAASILPADAKARLDFVSVDYVANAIAALVVANATGTFHLAAGWHESLTVREAADLAARALGRRRGAMLIPRGIAAPLRLAGAANPRKLVSRAEAYAIARDHLHQGAVFDTFVADRELEKLGIERPLLRNWLPAVVRAADFRAAKAPLAAHQISGTSARTSRV